MTELSHLWQKYYHLWVYGLVDSADNLYNVQIHDEKNPSLVGCNFMARLKEIVGGGAGGGFVDLGSGGAGGGFMRKLPKGAKIGDLLPVSADRHLPDDKGVRVVQGWNFKTRYVQLSTHTAHIQIAKEYEAIWQEILQSYDVAGKYHLHILQTLRHVPAENRSDILQKDCQQLLQQWTDAEQQLKNAKKPQILKLQALQAGDNNMAEIFIKQLPIKAPIIFSDENLMRQMKMTLQDPHLCGDFEYDADAPDIGKILPAVLEKPITFGEGGRLWVDEATAATMIDVDSAAEMKKGAGQFNLTAAEEVMRLVGCLNLGGIILVDFIRMKAPQDRRRLLEKLKSLNKRYHLQCDILGYSLSGFVEIIRRRKTPSLRQSLHYNKTDLALMSLHSAMRHYRQGKLQLTASADTIAELQTRHSDIISTLPLIYKTDETIEFPIVEIV